MNNNNVLDARTFEVAVTLAPLNSQYRNDLWQYIFDEFATFVTVSFFRT